MIPVGAVIVLLIGHWLFDFVGQSHYMAMNKSKNWSALSQHVAVIFVGALLTGALIHLLVTGKHPFNWWVLLFAVVNAATHFCIDAVTSRITGKLYSKGEYHNFFVVIGFDQLLHMSIAVATLPLVTS